MKRIFLFSLLCLSVSATFYSCKKADKNSPLPETETAKITIALPYENQVFSKGDTVFIRGTITCPYEMHGCEITIATTNGDTIFSESQHAHGKEIMFDDYWVHNVSSPAELQVIITATLDHDGNTAAKSISFKAQ